MSHAPTAASSKADALHFLLRRLHSLSGILPVGIFVVFHLFTNAQIVWGAMGFDDKFQHEVEFIHSLPALLFLEIFGLWLPIAFHAGLGFWYTFSGKSNIRHYGYQSNLRYAFQRVTGIIALIFIFLHVATLRWQWNFLGWFTPFYLYGVDNAGQEVGLASASTAVAIQSSFLVILLYLVGAMAVVYHWSNGLWTAFITWGVTTSQAAMKRWGYACAMLFLALTVFTIMAIVGSVTYKLSESEQQAYDNAKNGIRYVEDLERAGRAIETLESSAADTAGETSQVVEIDSQGVKSEPEGATYPDMLRNVE